MNAIRAESQGHLSMVLLQQLCTLAQTLLLIIVGEDVYTQIKSGQVAS